MARTKPRRRSRCCSATAVIQVPRHVVCTCVTISPCSRNGAPQTNCRSPSGSSGCPGCCRVTARLAPPCWLYHYKGTAEWGDREELSFVDYESLGLVGLYQTLQQRSDQANRQQFPRETSQLAGGMGSRKTRGTAV